MSTLQPPVEDQSADDTTIEFVQSKRMAIVHALLPADALNNNKEGGVCTENIQIAMKALDGLATTALGNKRVKVEEKSNQTQESAAIMIASLLGKLNTLKPFEREVKDGKVINGVTRVIPTLPAEVPPPVLVVGETATIAPQQSFESFTTGAPSITEDHVRDQ